MRRRPELMQLEMGISTRRYLPANGTAGLARSLVNGNRRLPCPPPMMTDKTALVFNVCRPVCDVTKAFVGFSKLPALYRRTRAKRKQTRAERCSVGAA